MEVISLRVKKLHPVQIIILIIQIPNDISQRNITGIHERQFWDEHAPLSGGEEVYVQVKHSRPGIAHQPPLHNQSGSNRTDIITYQAYAFERHISHKR